MSLTKSWVAVEDHRLKANELRLISVSTFRPSLPVICCHCSAWFCVDGPVGECHKRAPELEPEQKFPTMGAFESCREFERMTYPTEGFREMLDRYNQSVKEHNANQKSLKQNEKDPTDPPV